MFAGNFAPEGWHFCDGSLVPIQEYDALFALIGTTYGGDGQTTFALPDLRGRVPIHNGSGPGLTTRALGQTLGSEDVTLTAPQMPSHNHSLLASNQAPASNSPSNAVLAAATEMYESSASDLFALSANSVAVTGGQQPHDNMMPFLGINFIICMQGFFPAQQ